MKTPLIILALFISSLALAEDVDLAKRSDDEDFSTYFERAQESSEHLTYRAGTPLSTAKLYKEENLPPATDWVSYQTGVERFKTIRDIRFIKWNGRERRSSWLYPDDGCFARASLANKNLKLLDVPVPKKVFVFGNLKVRTANSPKGYVSWWYHVAPVFQVDGQKYVIDPAIDPHKPLRLIEWLDHMGTPSKLKVAICASGTYGPRSDCGKVTDGKETAALSAQKKYLTLEWNRLLNLGRSPSSELGDNPPWLAPH